VDPRKVMAKRGIDSRRAFVRTARAPAGFLIRTATTRASLKGVVCRAFVLV